MKIQILGRGCSKCVKLTEVAEQAANELGLAYQIEKVTEVERIAEAGVMMTPGLAVDGVLKSVGRVPSVEEVKRLLA